MRKCDFCDADSLMDKYDNVVVWECIASLHRTQYTYDNRTGTVAKAYFKHDGNAWVKSRAPSTKKKAS